MDTDRYNSRILDLLEKNIRTLELTTLILYELASPPVIYKGDK